MMPLSVVLKSRAPQLIFGALEKDIFMKLFLFGGRLCKGHVASSFVAARATPNQGGAVKYTPWQFPH